MLEIVRKTNEEIDKELREILESNTYIDQHDGQYIGYEIYVDYREEFGETSLIDISRADNTRETLEEKIEEWRFNAEEWYYPELLSLIRKEMEDYDDYEDEIRDWVNEYVFWYMPDSVTEQEVNVVISLDVGDMNYDFTCCNVLNYYGLNNKDNELDPNSPILWLAKQQGKLEELQKALKEEGLSQSTDFQKETQYSAFTRTTIQELQNACSHMNSLIFLCKMTLAEFVELKELVRSEEKLNDSYEYEERKGTKEFTVSKKANCGLYDIWNGGGSVLEIELEKDVVIPTKAVFDIWIDCKGCKANGRGYDVDDVYGLCGSCWSGEVKIA